jgi:hypothetical protein
VDIGVETDLAKGREGIKVWAVLASTNDFIIFGLECGVERKNARRQKQGRRAEGGRWKSRVKPMMHHLIAALEVNYIRPLPSSYSFSLRHPKANKTTTNNKNLHHKPVDIRHHRCKRTIEATKTNLFPCHIFMRIIILS